MKKKITSKTLLIDSKKVEKNMVEVSPADQFPIVGIGASAGGLEALEQFFINMTNDSGIAFVVIQHLDPTRTGFMPELLQRVTEMKVYSVTDRLKVRPNSIYVIPTNKSMSILNGSLHLFAPIETRGLRLPIDFFFRSLADELQGKSVGIILSGMGSDGTLGLKAIKEKAGIALVQSPETAKFDSMPRSAIDSVMTDIIAPANELPGKLLTILKQNVRISSNSETDKDTSSLEKIVILLRSRTGNDFSQYKKNTVYRRIERRMSIHQISKIAHYVRYLQENPAEVDILFNELLIGVTSFFRDPKVWEELKEKTIPDLIDGLPQKYMIRIWVPGCSTGEEAYSMAIVFKEVLEKYSQNKDIFLQVFATDIDSNAIETARKGIYQPEIAADMSQERLSRFFTKENNHYRINSEIRDIVVFAKQNVIKDPPFTKLDLLSCRNLLIYMDGVLQEKLLTLFHYSLNPQRILLLGSSETHGSQSNLFSVLNSKLRIYQRSNSPKTKGLLDFPSSFSRIKTVFSEDHIPAIVTGNIQTLTDQLLLQRLSAASVLVTNQGDILYITGSTGKYLEPAVGKANMNIFAMARQGLREELHLALRKAQKNYDQVLLHNLKIDYENGSFVTDVTIQQIETPLALKGMILVIFIDVQPLKINPSQQKKAKTLKNTFQAELELNLKKSREDFQSLSEEMQTSQEELKSANEELQSTNEELQSANEELTTSKEEMQSLNEELHTVNVELLGKIDYSARVNNDMNNLLRSIEIATLFLDKDLKIRQFTAPITRIFKMIQSDIGRLFTDQVNILDYPDMYTDAVEVLRTLSSIEKDVPADDGRWFNIRIMPYRTTDDKIDGLVITFIDITRSKQLEHVLRKSQLTLKSFIAQVPGVIIGMSSDGIIMEYNPEAEKLLGLKHDDVMGKNYFDLFVPESSRRKVASDMKKLLSGTFPDHYNNLVRAANGDNLLIEWSSHKIFDDAGTVRGIINIGINIIKS